MPTIWANGCALPPMAALHLSLVAHHDLLFTGIPLEVVFGGSFRGPGVTIGMSSMGLHHPYTPSFSSRVLRWGFLHSGAQQKGLMKDSSCSFVASKNLNTTEKLNLNSLDWAEQHCLQAEQLTSSLGGDWVPSAPFALPNFGLNSIPVTDSSCLATRAGMPLPCGTLHHTGMGPTILPAQVH